MLAVAAALLAAVAVDCDDPPTPAATQRAAAFVGNYSTRVFHRRGCGHIRRIDDRNVIGFATSRAAVDAGYRPCKHCRP